MCCYVARGTDPGTLDTLYLCPHHRAMHCRNPSHYTSQATTCPLPPSQGFATAGRLLTRLGHPMGCSAVKEAGEEGAIKAVRAALVVAQRWGFLLLLLLGLCRLAEFAKAWLQPVAGMLS